MNRPSYSRFRRDASQENRRAAALSNLGARRGIVRQARARSTPAEIPAPPRSSLPVATLGDLAGDWVAAAEVAARSPRTIQGYADLRRRLLWWLDRAGHTDCSADELRGFLRYVAAPPTPAAPRWDDRRFAQNFRAVSLSTLAAYHRDLTALFNHLCRLGAVQVNPLAQIPRPHPAPPVIETFTPAQFRALLEAARRSYYPSRNTALLWFLADTGARAGEVVGLLSARLDLANRRALVLGKGRKERILPFGAGTARALWAYRSEFRADLPERVFVADQGSLRGERLTESGLFQLIQRLGEKAKLEGVRCSPHTFRHTFAIEFLRGGGGELALQEILGHTSLAMVQRYARLARADVQERHRVASPADRLKRG